MGKHISKPHGPTAFILLASLPLLFAPAARAATACSPEALNALHTPDVSITAATSVPATPTIPEHCKVMGSIITRGELLQTAPPAAY
jgi:hypothetical protein